MTRLRQLGVTLLELVIALLVISILAAIAYPAYQGQVSSSRRADAQAALLGFANALERFHTTNGGTYTGAVVPTQWPTTGTTIYSISVTIPAGGATYTLTATPVGPQAGDGVLTYNSAGAKTWGSKNCWDC